MELSLFASIGIPGSLTIDVGPSEALIAGRLANLVAPLNQPITSSGALMSKAWGPGWSTPISQRLIALGGNTKYQVLELLCPSLDTTDMLWGMTASIDGTTDPVTITGLPFGIPPGSIYNRSFEEGDYILWDDPAVVNGMYQYEIDRIVTVRGNNFTLSRGTSAGLRSRAYFGTPRAPHTGINFYRLIAKTFTELWQGEEQTFKFLWDNMIVAAVQATTVGLTTPTLLSLIPIPPDPAFPGLPT